MKALVVFVYLLSFVLGVTFYLAYLLIMHGEAAMDNAGISTYFAAYVGVIIGISALFYSTKFIKNKPENEELCL